MVIIYWIGVVWVTRRCYCYENLSRRPSTTVTQSSTLKDRRAHLINDGDYSTVFWSCAHTGYNYSKAWAQVDLGESYRINSVKIYYRIEDEWKPKRFRHFYLDVSDLPVTQTTTRERTRCYSDHTNYPDFPPNIIEIVCRYTARYVIVETIYDAPDDTHDGAILEICEIEVYGCSTNCASNACDDSGVCTRGCKIGFVGSRCETPCHVKLQELQDSNSRYEYALAGVVLVLLIVLAYNGWMLRKKYCK